MPEFGVELGGAAGDVDGGDPGAGCQELHASLCGPAVHHLLAERRRLDVAVRAGLKREGGHSRSSAGRCSSPRPSCKCSTNDALRDTTAALCRGGSCCGTDLVAVEADVELEDLRRAALERRHPGVRDELLERRDVEAVEGPLPRLALLPRELRLALLGQVRHQSLRALVLAQLLERLRHQGLQRHILNVIDPGGGGGGGGHKAIGVKGEKGGSSMLL